MPIRADLRHHYGREWRTVVRPRILARAKDRCENCRKRNHWRVITRTEPGEAMYWCALGSAVWRDETGEKLNRAQTREIFGLPLRTIRVVLTVAHLNHDPADNRDENLRALCQWCHLHHDQAHHKDTRSARKDRARPLLAGTETEERCHA